MTATIAEYMHATCGGQIERRAAYHANHCLQTIVTNEPPKAAKTPSEIVITLHEVQWYPNTFQPATICYRAEFLSEFEMSGNWFMTH